MSSDMDMDITNTDRRRLAHAHDAALAAVAHLGNARVETEGENVELTVYYVGEARRLLREALDGLDGRPPVALRDVVAIGDGIVSLSHRGELVRLHRKPEPPPSAA